MENQDAASDRADRIMRMRDDEQPFELSQLIKARNKALHLMIRRFGEMKPAEVIAAISVLDGEIATKRVREGPNGEKKEPTREEMLAQLQIAQKRGS